jgi:hypothetical protein
VGFFCVHGQPLRGTFAPMPAHETFAFYVPGLDVITNERSLQLFGMDNACQFLQHLRAKGLQYDGVTFATGEMHGVSHVMSCQLANLSIFKEGVGRVVLEQSEQAWAEVKFPAKNIR